MNARQRSAVDLCDISSSLRSLIDVQHVRFAFKQFTRGERNIRGESCGDFENLEELGRFDIRNVGSFD